MHGHINVSFGKFCLFHLHRRVGTLHTYLPMKKEQIGCSETSAYKIRTSGNYPEESIQHSEHDESLKSRFLLYACNDIIFLNNI